MIDPLQLALYRQKQASMTPKQQFGMVEDMGGLMPFLQANQPPANPFADQMKAMRQAGSPMGYVNSVQPPPPPSFQEQVKSFKQAGGFKGGAGFANPMAGAQRR